MWAVGRWGALFTHPRGDPRLVNFTLLCCVGFHFCACPIAPPAVVELGVGAHLHTASLESLQAASMRTQACCACCKTAESNARVLDWGCTRRHPGASALAGSGELFRQTHHWVR